MERNVNNSFVMLTVLLVIATLTVAVAAPPDSTTTNTTAETTGTEKTPPPVPLPRGPISVYDNSCARCHGANGSFYGPTLGQGKTDQELRTVIREMADGPGNETLTPVELDAQTAYHRAMIRKEPFVAVTVRKSDMVEGEVTPGATVSVRRKDAEATPAAEVAAKVEGNHWSLSLPGVTEKDAVIVTVRQNKAGQSKPEENKIEVSIDTSLQLWSQAQPLPALKTEKAN